MTTHFEAGDLVATTRDLQNRNHPDRPLPADTLGIVIAVGPSFVQLDVFGRSIHVRPDALTIVEKEFLTLSTPGGPGAAALWDLWALAARREHELITRLSSLVDSTRAEPRLARPGLNGS